MDTRNEIKRLLTELTNYEGIPAGDIPDIALYMDQVTTFMDRKLKVFKRREDDSILTKTMINNYTKARLSIPPVNKKYEKEHIMLLTLIYHMKQILSANDMKKLFGPVINKIDAAEDGARSAEELYGIFTAMEKEQLELFDANVNEIISHLSSNSDLADASDKDFMIMFILTLVIQAERRKNLAEKLIDVFFTEPPEPKEKKKEEEKPKQKISKKEDEKPKQKNSRKEDEKPKQKSSKKDDEKSKQKNNKK